MPSKEWFEKRERVRRGENSVPAGQLCEFGCLRPALYQLLNLKFCCCFSWLQCPSNLIRSRSPHVLSNVVAEFQTADCKSCGPVPTILVDGYVRCPNHRGRVVCESGELLVAWQKQKHQCAICRTVLLIPYLDHEHESGVFRGFLCNLCNLGLGLFKDNVANLTAAVEYLRGETHAC